MSDTQEVMISDSLAVSSFSSAESHLESEIVGFLCDLLTKQPTSVVQTLMKS